MRKGGEFFDFDAAFELGDDTDYQAYVAIEQPIPLIPNILVQHTQSRTGGDGELDLAHNEV